MAHFTHATATLKADRTVVTEADLAVQALLVNALVQNYPLDGIIAEEEDLRKGSRSGRYWTVDPIDGTVPFVAGLTSWSIALGLLEKCQPVSGYVYVPASADFYHSEPGRPACRNGRPMRVKSPGPLGPQRGSHKFKLGIGELLWRWTLVSTIPFQSYEPLTACFGEG